MAKGSFLVVPGGGAGPCSPSAWAATSSTSPARTRCSPARTTSPTARPRPTRRTRCGCWRPSWASTASGSTAINPDGVVRGSGIFAGGWGAQRAAVYGVPEEELGAFYAQRTLLKREVLPEHVADAVVRAHRRRAVATPPACTSRSTPASPPPSCDDRRAAGAGGARRGRPRRVQRPGHARPGRARTSLELTEVAPVPTTAPVRLPGRLHWDILGLYRGVLDGLRAQPAAAAGAAGGSASTRGRWTTGCSTPDGRLLGNPVHYRDARTDGVARPTCIAKWIPPTSCTHQRAAVPAVQHPLPTRAPPARAWRRLARLLLIPDLLALLADRRGRAAEVTNASTTGLLDARTGDWATELVGRLGMPAGAASRPRHGRPGPRPVGCRARCRPSSGCDRPVPVIAVGSHDTASAVVGVPARHRAFAYISCGTWSLVGRRARPSRC